VNNILIFLSSLASVFIILGTTSGWVFNVNAQGEPSINSSSLGTNTTPIINSSLIITPWNTGNERNNGSASNTD
jgi:hypothetical protein